MMEHDATSVCEGGFHELAITIRYQYHYIRAERTISLIFRLAAIARWAKRNGRWDSRASYVAT